jgi:non-homologous end joining protein Ku
MLKLGLVTVPCRLLAASDTSDKVKFNLLHGACRTRIQQKTWCPTCAKEIRAAEQVRTFDDLELPRAPVPNPGDLALAKQLFANYEGAFSPEDVTDAYTQRLRALLLLKAQGGEVVAPTAPVVPSVLSLSEALRQSLAATVAA